MPKLGMTLTAGHDPRIRAVARDYAQTSGLDYNPPTVYQKVDPERAKRIAAAYEAMPHDPDHPLVKASYNALLNETLGQYQAMKRADRMTFQTPLGEIRFTPEGEVIQNQFYVAQVRMNTDGRSGRFQLLPTVPTP
jgi:hypothetical protein